MLWRVRGRLAKQPCDQDVVWNRSSAGADAEESIERRMACAAAIETEHELVQVVLVLSFAGRGKRPGPSA